MKKSTVAHFCLISRPPLSGMMQSNEMFGLARNCNSVILACFQYMDYAAEAGIRFSNHLAFQKWSTDDAFYWYRLEKNSSACTVMGNISYLFFFLGISSCWISKNVQPHCCTVGSRDVSVHQQGAPCCHSGYIQVNIPNVIQHIQNQTWVF